MTSAHKHPNGWYGFSDDIVQVDDMGEWRAGVTAPYNVGVSHMWYRRLFRIPHGWWQLRNAARTLLHFGAVDWESQVWVNGVEFDTHQGG